nr:MAG TPA: hypothetical protein [Caudoviricetes sp.]
MVTIKSRVYSQHTLKFKNGTVKFHNGVATVSDELYQEIVDGQFPNIYKEGEEPEYKTKIEEQLRTEIKKDNEEYENEIRRLKNVIESQEIELSKKDGEIESWKKLVEELKAGKTEPVKTETKEETEDDNLLADLKATKVDDLKALAMSEEGGSYSEEDLKGKRKDEIIEMILSKA